MTLTKSAILVGIATFLVVVVLFFPASLAWHFAAERVPPGQLALRDITGTPWAGRAVASGQFLPTGEFAWDLHVLDLLGGTLHADVVLRGPAHHLTATLLLERDRLELTDASGWVAAEAVNAQVEPLGYQVSGKLGVSGLNARSDGHWLTALRGELEWSGGKLAYASAVSNLLYHLPPLTGSLGLEETTVTASVRESGAPTSLFDFRLDADGWASVAMRKRLFDLVEQQAPMQGAPDDVVMELSSQLWR